MPQPLLVLFDIDGTLLDTGGAGRRCMVDAARALHGSAITDEGIDFAGRLDPVLFREVIASAGTEPTERRVRALHAEYARRLTAYFAQPRPDAVALPGVRGLLDALASEPGLTLGVLTGNMADTGSTKLAACGLDPRRFPVSAWGGDAPEPDPRREHLPPVAMARFEARGSGAIDPRRVVIVGDTPHDIRCARANGCRAIAVATGRFSAGELASHGPDAVLEDLAPGASLVTRLLDAAAG